MAENYCSWVITHNPWGPATGTWTATRHGVSMCNNSKESIKRMVDRKLWEQQTERDQRNKEC